MAGYDFKIVYHPGNLNGKPDMLSRQLEYCPEKGDNSQNGRQPISLILKPEHFVSKIMLESIGMRTVISESILYAVLQIKFNADLMECVDTAATEDQEWQYAYNTAKDDNLSIHVEYLHKILYYKERLWISAKDNLLKMIYKIEHDSKVVGHRGWKKPSKS
jgi:hypothetical protein